MKKLLMTALSACLLLSLSISAHASTKLTDNADLLNASEEAEVLAALDEVSEKYGLDIAVATVQSTDGISVVAYADDFYDARYDEGAMLLISMEDRDWYITTYGEGTEAFTDEGISLIGDDIYDDLSDGDYADAFLTFASDADKYIKLEREGNPVDVGSEPKGAFPWAKYLLISIVAGLACGGIYVFSLKSQLKSVVANNRATEYVKNGSFKLTENSDRFLYMHLNKVPRPQNEGNGGHGGGGSTTHVSSSGRSHGGGGGHF